MICDPFMLKIISEPLPWWWNRMSLLPSLLKSSLNSFALKRKSAAVRAERFTPINVSVFPLPKSTMVSKRFWLILACRAPKLRTLAIPVRSIESPSLWWKSIMVSAPAWNTNVSATTDHCIAAFPAVEAVIANPADEDIGEFIADASEAARASKRQVLNVGAQVVN